MPLFCIHKWTEWSDPIKEKIKTVTYHSGMLSSHSTTHHYGHTQVKRCQKCNKVKTRKVKY